MMKHCGAISLVFVISAGWVGRISGQSIQNPSPMVERIREHPRLEKQVLPGERIPLSIGSLSILQPVRELTQEKSSAGEQQDSTGIPLVIALHCGDWIPELAVSRLPSPLPCLTVQLGAGSSGYSKPFAQDEGLLDRLVGEASQQLNLPISEVVLVGWSAGYGAIGQILSQPEIEAKISAVLLIDGLHTGYESGKPGPKESALQTGPLEPFLEYARMAVQGSRRMTIVHSEIFPGTYASTTETADWLLKQLDLKRRAVLRWGPMRTQILGETQQGNLTVRAFAGNSAPDHVDLLHALPELLEELLRD